MMMYRRREYMIISTADVQMMKLNIIYIYFYAYYVYSFSRTDHSFTSSSCQPVPVQHRNLASSCAQHASATGPDECIPTEIVLAYDAAAGLKGHLES